MLSSIKKIRSNKIIQAYFGQLPSLRRSLARFFANPEDVEDVLQETFVRVCKARDENVSNFKGYLHRTARNIAINELNRKARTITSYIDDVCGDDIESGDVPVDQQVSDKQQMEAFGHAVASLPEKCRRVFLLSKLYGLKQKEVASHMNISQSTVEKHLAKAIVVCRDYMIEHGYQHTNIKLIKTSSKRSSKE